MIAVIRTIPYLVFFYVIPLLGVPERILHWQILVLMAACGVIFLTQPPIDLRAAAKKPGPDRYSVFAILAGGAVSQIVPVVEWGYFRDAELTSGDWIWVGLGGAMLVIALGFRIWSIRMLGTAFTSVVETSENQRIVTSGPYSLVRHPSYLGALVATMGIAIFLRAWFGAVVAAAAMTLAYFYRINVEEKELVRAFGDAYVEFQGRTKSRLLPGIW